MPDTAGIEIRFTSLDDPHGAALSARQREEILQSVPDLPPFHSDIPIFIILLRNNEAIACGGLRPLSGAQVSVAEIKRFYVVPEARGQAKGISDFLLQQLETHALERGWTILQLQTGTIMLAANKFYERHGYRQITNYGEFIGSDHTLSFKKVLSHSSHKLDMNL